MRRRAIRLALCALLSAVLAFAVWSARPRACGPFFRRAVFVLKQHPDFPLDRFAAGRLGIVAPTWARSQLFVAYRYLSGTPLDDAEQRAALALWSARLHRRWPDTDAPASWLEARKAVPGAPAVKSIDAYRYLPQAYVHYLNCPDAAFATASRTLAARIQQFGASNEAVADWLRAQDQVFANCATPPDGAGAAAPQLPAPASPSLPPIIRADRTYQIASALFYGGRFEEAARAFAAIATDRGSPWRPIGRYLEARALVRQGTINEDPASLSRAEALLRELPGDAATPELRAAVVRLLGFVRARTAPGARILELADSLARPGRGADLQQDLWDYTVLLDRLVEPIDLARAGQRSAGSESPPRPDTLLPSGVDDLTDWILTFQGYHRAAHALDRWRETRSAAWLVATIALAQGRDEAAPALIQAYKDLAPASPAFPTAAYHAVRLLIETGQADGARAALDAVLPGARRDWPVSTVNALLAQRAAVARGLDEFAAFSLRQPALFTFDEDGRELPVDDDPAQPSRAGADAAVPAPLLLGDDAAETINRQLTLAQMTVLAHSTALPVEWRQAVARAAWVRAVLLDTPLQGERAARTIARDPSSATSRLRPLLARYLSATPGPDRRFAAVFAVLRHPGASPFLRGGLPRETPLHRIDNFRDNWWCAPPEENTLPADGLFPPLRVRSEASAELSRLTAAGPAPNYLAKQVLDYARRRPDDERVPEALALVVRATRFGCDDQNTTKWSRAAFTLLHREYPGTSWARATRYYY